MAAVEPLPAIDSSPSPAVIARKPQTVPAGEKKPPLRTMTRGYPEHFLNPDDPFEHRHYQSYHPTCNKILAKRWEDHTSFIHHMKLKQAKPTIDNTQPKVYPHLEMRLKRMQIEDERLRDIERKNHILLDRIAFQMINPSAVSNLRLLTAPDERKAVTISAGTQKRKRDMIKIAQENMTILQRIEDKAPYYNRLEWLADRRRNLGYLFNIAQYPKTYIKVLEEEGESEFAIVKVKRRGLRKDKAANQDADRPVTRGPGPTTAPLSDVGTDIKESDPPKPSPPVKSQTAPAAAKTQTAPAASSSPAVKSQAAPVASSSTPAKSHATPAASTSPAAKAQATPTSTKSPPVKTQGPPAASTTPAVKSQAAPTPKVVPTPKAPSSSPPKAASTKPSPPVKPSPKVQKAEKKEVVKKAEPATGGTPKDKTPAKKAVVKPTTKPSVAPAPAANTHSMDDFDLGIVDDDPSTVSGGKKKTNGSGSSRPSSGWSSFDNAQPSEPVSGSDAGGRATRTEPAEEDTYGAEEFEEHHEEHAQHEKHVESEQGPATEEKMAVAEPIIPVALAEIEAVKPKAEETHDFFDEPESKPVDALKEDVPAQIEEVAKSAPKLASRPGSSSIRNASPLPPIQSKSSRPTSRPSSVKSNKAAPLEAQVLAHAVASSSRPGTAGSKVRFDAAGAIPMSDEVEANIPPSPKGELPPLQRKGSNPGSRPISGKGVRPPLSRPSSNHGSKNALATGSNGALTVKKDDTVDASSVLVGEDHVNETPSTAADPELLPEPKVEEAQNPLHKDDTVDSSSVIAATEPHFEAPVAPKEEPIAESNGVEEASAAEEAKYEEEEFTTPTDIVPPAPEAETPIIPPAESKSEDDAKPVDEPADSANDSEGPKPPEVYEEEQFETDDAATATVAPPVSEEAKAQEAPIAEPEEVTDAAPIEEAPAADAAPTKGSQSSEGQNVDELIEFDHNHKNENQASQPDDQAVENVDGPVDDIQLASGSDEQTPAGIIAAVQDDRSMNYADLEPEADPVVEADKISAHTPPPAEPPHQSRPASKVASKTATPKANGSRASSAASKTQAAAVASKSRPISRAVSKKSIAKSLAKSKPTTRPGSVKSVGKQLSSAEPELPSKEVAAE
ncbi:hypothetical protein HDU97_001450 [Phlyctochytrium planicorne]|nr:hypothetical protein HDU97_001450 [Phlyctochytrium planicorne]